MMRTVRQFLLYLILFFVVFIASGEAYIFFVDARIPDADYYFECEIENPQAKEAYADTLEELGEQLNLQIYAVNYTPVSRATGEYQIYAINASTEKRIKEKLHLTDNETKLHSCFSGDRRIRIDSIEKISQSKHVLYYVWGNENDVEQLRSATIDEFGTGKPYATGSSGDYMLILLTAWSLFLVFAVFISVSESVSLRKEICVRYLNGMSKEALIFREVLKNALVILCAASGAFLWTLRLSEVSTFLLPLVIVTVAVMGITGFVYIANLRKLEVREVFAKPKIGPARRIASVVILAVVFGLFSVTLSVCLENLDDAWKTIRQQPLWEKYADYDSVTFFSQEETAYANHELDNVYGANFYQQYNEEYDISLCFNLANNGGMYSMGCDEDLVYMNLNGLQKSNLPIRKNELAENKYYIISTLTQKEIEQNESLWSAITSTVKTLQGSSKGMEEVEFMVPEKNYRITTLDINAKNLSDNQLKNPCILVDTHRSFDDSFGANVCTGIVKFTNQHDFETYIRSIGYEAQAWYRENVWTLYEEKRDEKSMIALLNLTIAVVLGLLFNLLLYLMLKIEFQNYSDEIAIRKILGQSFFKRYRMIFNTIAVLVAIYTTIILVVGLVWQNRYNLYLLLSGMMMIVINIAVILLWFAMKFEKKNIPKVLKGGY